MAGSVTNEPRAGVADNHPVDGRNARRSRNRDKVIDAVLELFEEELVVPGVGTIAERSGLSLRSLYRYFEDQDALMRAAIERSNELAAPLLRIHEFGTGPLDLRISRLVEMRLGLYEAVGATYRATTHNAPLSPEISAALDATRDALRDQTERQFAPELSALGRGERRTVATACDLLTQLDSIEQCRRQRGLSLSRTADVLQHALTALLG